MHDLEVRVKRLERSNRLLALVAAACAALVVFAAIVGWQQAEPAELIRAKRIEIVDARGVPLVTLEQTRGSEGGSIVLRDSSGDRRAWFTTGVGSARLGMVSGEEDRPTSTLGLNVESGQAHVALSSGKASASTSVETEGPNLELINQQGKSVFSAPWKR